MTIFRWCLGFLIFAPTLFVHADQVEMLNGDRYVGAVLTMSADTVFLQSDVLGQIKIPRGKVSTISLGKTAIRPAASANNVPVPASIDASGPLAELATHTNLVDGIKKQFLGDAGPEANGKFDELMGGLMTGKIDINGLRAQAKSAADQLRAMKKDSGGEGSVMLDAYLSILDKFLADEPEAPQPAVAAPVTNSPRGITIIR